MESLDTQKFANESEPVGIEGALSSGTVLEKRYRIAGIAGFGGMGSVYQARDLRFPNVTRYVAVKEMLNLAPDPALREITIRNFEREANVLASLSHPAVPEIYDYFNIGDRAYLVMEYINGRDLEAIINSVSEPLPIDVVVEWAIEICDVLHYLHTHEPDPIVFRDVKPSNIMIDQHRNVRLIDFGIAKNFQAGQKGTMIGTEGYSPPEQYKGEATPVGDIYALGATLHHVFTGRDPRLEPPFSFADRSIKEINKGVSAQLEAVIMKALNYDKKERYQNAQEMKKAFEKLTQPQAGPSMAMGQTYPMEGESSLLSSEGGVLPVWTFACEDEVRSSPIVVNGRVYVGAYDYNLYCLDAADGNFIWKYATEGGIATTPDYSQAEDIVLLGSQDGKFYAIKAEDGRVFWTHQTEQPIYGSPRVAHGHVFFGGEDGNLYAIRAANGRVAWKIEIGAAIRCRPYVSDDRIVIGNEEGDVTCLDLSGNIKWRYGARRSVMSSPQVHDGIVYVGSRDNHLYALDMDNGWAIWRFRADKSIVGSPTNDENYVYVGSVDGKLYALDIRNGKEAWHFETEGQITTSNPLLHNGALYFGSTDKHIYCVEAQSGKLRWKYETEDVIVSSPFLDDGMVYIGSNDHNVYALMS
jgi:outer membrane protein assembly factor BamB